ncbi:TetR family transcriptional regulator [Pantoea sp. 18069]|uniref:TetR family transcriptional regulator n=1 Tax=Pantoea sp. 18069 TaxID=2681415 RepID=UPI00135A059E|nr:TetR family transcriptional regulator [Pantoea sp. 18069]
MARRTKEDAVATRNALLDAAEQVFLAQGVSQSSLAAIAKQAGATRGAVYWHFKDKLDLFNAMIDRVAMPLDQIMYGGVGQFADAAPLPRMCRVMYLLLHGLVTDERICRVFTIMKHRVEFVGELAALQVRHTSSLNDFTRQLALDFAAAAEHGGLELRHSPQLLATGLRSLVDGLIHSWLLGLEGFDLERDGFAAIQVYLIGAGLPQAAVRAAFEEAASVPCPQPGDARVPCGYVDPLV